MVAINLTPMSCLAPAAVPAAFPQVFERVGKSVRSEQGKEALTSMILESFK